MSKAFNILLIFGVLLLLGTISFPLVSSVESSQNAGTIRNNFYTGYQVTGPYHTIKGPFNTMTMRVEGSWIVPTANCTKTPNSVSNISAVIDGISGEGDGMMIGTYQNCVNGVPHYGAFVNVYPFTKFYANKTGIESIVIHPGDLIEAQGTWRQIKGPIDWNMNFVDHTHYAFLDIDADTPNGFAPKMDSGAIILSSDGHILTSLSTILSGKEYTHQGCSDVTGPERVCNSFGTMANISGFTLVKLVMPGTTLSGLRINGSSFEISRT